MTPKQAGDIYYLCDASGHGGIGGTIEVLAASNALCTAGGGGGGGNTEDDPPAEDDEEDEKSVGSTDSSGSGDFPVAPVAIGGVVLVGLGGLAMVMSNSNSSAGPPGFQKGAMMGGPAPSSGGQTRSRVLSNASKGSRGSGGRGRSSSGGSRGSKASKGSKGGRSKGSRGSKGSKGRGRSSSGGRRSGPGRH